MNTQCTHTLTIDNKAYELLKAAKRSNESFSRVIRRAFTPAKPATKLKIQPLTPAYLQKEYGLTRKEAEAFPANLKRAHERAKAAGEYISVKSCLDLLK